MSDTPGVEMKGSQARQDALAVMVGDTGFTMAGLAEVFVQSGFFKDVKGQAQAIVKVLYGRELGISPLQSMIAINMVEGRPEVAAATLGAIIKRHGKYDYRIKELDATKCAIEFFEGKAETGVSIGVARFTVEDATRAGLARKFNYTAYPEDMMFNRALSRGVKRFCLDAVGCVPVYSEGEIREARDASVAAGEVLDITASSSGLAEPGAEVNPFASAKKVETPAEAVDPPKAARKARAVKVEPEPVAEVVDPICGTEYAGVRCTGPRGHEGACMFPPVWGSEDCPTAGCWAGVNHEGPHVFEDTGQDREAGEASAGAPVDVQGEDAPPPASSGPTRFTLFGKLYETAGMTSQQMAESYELAAQVDKSPLGKGYARGLLAKLMRVPVPEATRLKLTEEAAERYLQALRQAAAAGPAQGDLP